MSIGHLIMYGSSLRLQLCQALCKLDCQGQLFLAESQWTLLFCHALQSTCCMTDSQRISYLR